jgi:hypothetical protein
VNTETAVYKYLKRKLPEVDWQRVENWAGAGVPDVNGAFLWPANGREIGFEIWCELKVCKTKAYKTKDLWRPSQIAYITRRSCKFANIWNLVSHPQAEVLRIYSGDKTASLSTDSTGSIEPDLVLPFKGPWTTFLDLAARRILAGRATGSKDPTDSIDPPAAIDPLGR